MASKVNAQHQTSQISQLGFIINPDPHAKLKETLKFVLAKFDEGPEGWRIYPVCPSGKAIRYY